VSFDFVNTNPWPQIKIVSPSNPKKKKKTKVEHVESPSGDGPVKQLRVMSYLSVDIFLYKHLSLFFFHSLLV
jgi:hypothetical protein